VGPALKVRECLVCSKVTGMDRKTVPSSRLNFSRRRGIAHQPGTAKGEILRTISGVSDEGCEGNIVQRKRA